MADKFPYLAKQINGPIANSFGKGIDHVYEADADFIGWLSKFSLDTVNGAWLDKLGIVMGVPRPYVVIPTIAEAFTFDTYPQVLDGRIHGFSSTKEMDIDGNVVSRDDGGLLTSTMKDDYISPLSDREYKRFLLAFCMLKNDTSLKRIGDVVSAMVGDDRFYIEFLQDTRVTAGDILIKLPGEHYTYKESLQDAFDTVFTTSPKVYVEADLNFDDEQP